MGSAKTATFVNMLAQHAPRSFISGNLVKVDEVLQKYNKAEFHHIYPKAYLETVDKDLAKAIGGTLANFCFLSRTDNNKIRAKAPSNYRSIMPKDEVVLQDILDRALIPGNVFDDDFRRFIAERVVMLANAAMSLYSPTLQEGGVQENPSNIS
jgi:hypothetical protein